MMFTVFFFCGVLTVIGVQAGPKCPARDGSDSVYFPDKNCSKFWQCSNGTPYRFDCPANLHFNPKLNVCDWPDQAGCKGGSGSTGSGSDEIKNDSRISDITDEEYYSEEEPSIEINDNIINDDENSSSDSSSSSSSESNENGTGGNTGNGSKCLSVDGKFPVYIPDKDCTKFWECSNGTPHLFKCSDGLHFNSKLNVCDWPEDAGCKSN